jgi:hypothetical protein
MLMRALPYALCLALVFATIVVPSAHAAADAPGTASGSYRHAVFKQRDATVRHAVAVRSILAEEGQTTPMIRIVLSDTPVPVSDLKGARTFPPFVDLPQSARPEAIIIDYAPGKPDGTRIATLTADPEAILSGYEFHSQTSEGPFVWERIAVAGDVIAGAMTQGEYDFRFAAQIIDDPVTGQLRGAQAQAHPISAVWAQSVNAILAGDATLAKSFLSQRASADQGRNTPDYWPELIKSYRANRATMLKATKFGLIIVRGDRATAVSTPAPGARMTAYFSFENGVWTIDG